MSFVTARLKGPSRIAYLCSRAESRNPWLAVIRLAEETLSKCTTTAPPVSIEELCELRRVMPVEMYLAGFAARLLAVGDHYIAEVNERHPETRRRFSICHELGHTFFEQYPGSDGNGSLCGNGSYEQLLEERLCDTFAAEFLMPRDLFGRLVLDCRPGMESVRRIAKSFHVSTQSAARRIIELDLWPLALVLFHNRGSNQAQLRGCKRSRSLGIRLPVSAVMRAIRSQDRPSGRVEVPSLPNEVSVEYYTYGAPPNACVCSLLFLNSSSAH